MSVPADTVEHMLRCLALNQPTREDVVAAIRAHHYRVSNEDALQTGLADVFTTAGFPVQREAVLNAQDRVDFLVGNVAVEVKTAGSVIALARQVQRYAHSDKVDSIVVVTTRIEHLQLPRALAGVTVTVVHVSGWLR